MIHPNQPGRQLLAHRLLTEEAEALIMVAAVNPSMDSEGALQRTSDARALTREAHLPCFEDVRDITWRGRRESNPRWLLGKQPSYH